LSLSQIELRCEEAGKRDRSGSEPEIAWPLPPSALPAPASPSITKGKAGKETSMDRQVKQGAQLTFETVGMSELTLVSGGIWDYSNRLGPHLGQMLEDRQDRRYGDVLSPPKNLDEAAGRALQGWVSIP
jgi:hypothetical protein